MCKFYAYFPYKYACKFTLRQTYAHSVRGPHFSLFSFLILQSIISTINIRKFADFHIIVRFNTNFHEIIKYFMLI